jgi:hypothetical protein
MKKVSFCALALLIATTGCAEEPAASAESAPATNRTPELRAQEASQSPAPDDAAKRPGTISVQEMLVSGPSQLKLHSLAMISQGNIPGEVDASYLPGFRVCSKDPALPLRSVTAMLVGRHFLHGQEKPNPEALAIVVELAKDEAADVRFNAVYHGLSQLPNKSDDILHLLIDIASTHPAPSLYDRIVDSLKEDRERTTSILDQKLAQGDNVSIYEIYEDLAGKKPSNVDRYLEMPSSRPHLFIFRGADGDPEAMKSELEQALKRAEIENAQVTLSGSEANHVLLVKTYIIKDYIAVKEAFAAHPDFKITQDMWLTPEMEVQIEAMKKPR